MDETQSNWTRTIEIYFSFSLVNWIEGNFNTATLKMHSLALLAY